MNAVNKIEAFLKAHPGSTAKEICAGTGLPNGTVVSTIWELGRKNRVERVRDTKFPVVRNYLATKKCESAPKATPPEPVGTASEPSKAARPVAEIFHQLLAEQAARSPLGDALTACVDQLAATLASEIAVRLEELLTRHVVALTQSIPDVVTEVVRVPPVFEAPVEAAVEAAPEEVAVLTPKAPKKRVVVCGLWDALHRFVEQEFKDCFDLTLINPDEHPSRIAAKAKKADIIIVMTSYVRHAFSEVVTATGHKPINVTGSLSMLRQKLTELYVEQ